MGVLGSVGDADDVGKEITGLGSRYWRFLERTNAFYVVNRRDPGQIFVTQGWRNLYGTVL